MRTGFLLRVVLVANDEVEPVANVEHHERARERHSADGVDEVRQVVFRLVVNCIRSCDWLDSDQWHRVVVFDVAHSRRTNGSSVAVNNCHFVLGSPESVQRRVLAAHFVFVMRCFRVFDHGLKNIL